MRFSVQEGPPLEGVLVYTESEYGFSFRARDGEALGARLGSQGVTSVVIGTLQLEVDIESGEVLFAWGYLPNVRSVVAETEPPRAVAGRVLVSPEERFDHGISVRVPGDDWRVTHDPSSGTVAVRLNGDSGATFVRIADGTVLGLDGGHLVSVWLTPLFVE
ncbi:hypothetical protein [Streptomyces sp. NPDC002640]